MEGFEMRHLRCVRHRQRISRLTTTLLFCNLLLIVLVLRSKSDGRSVNELRELADQMNFARLTNALQYIRTLNASRSQGFYKENLAKPNLDLVVSIPTVRRPIRSGHRGEGYLIQTAAMFDRLLKADQHFGGKMMLICNTDRTPKEHSGATLLQDHIPSVQLYGNSTSKVVTIMKNISDYRKSGGNKYSKEAFDYMFCLQTALLYKPKYIIMAQDDALPREELLPILDQLLRRQQGLLSSGDSIKRNPFFLMKLYYPVRWLGYAFELPRIIELVGIGAFGWGLFALLFSFFWKRSYYETLAVATLGGAGLLLLAILMGRLKVMELRHLSSHLYLVRRAPVCCTPAVLYRADIVSKLLGYLSQGTYDSDRPIDIAIGEYSDAIEQRSIYVEPNLFRHTGMYSSLDKSPKDPEYYLFQ